MPLAGVNCHASVRFHEMSVPAALVAGWMGRLFHHLENLWLHDQTSSRLDVLKELDREHHYQDRLALCSDAVCRRNMALSCRRVVVTRCR